MNKLIITLGLALISTTVGFSQSKLTQKQITKRNYQEVIGGKSSSAEEDMPDRYAMYPDGSNGIQKHIMKNLTYPSNAYNNGIKGRVVLRFVVEKNGQIEEIEVIQSVDPELDAEAIRVIKKLKAWVPGYKDGKPVRVEYKYPFNFQF